MVLCVVNVDARFRCNPVDGSIVWDDGTDLYFRDYCHDTLGLIFVKQKSGLVGAAQNTQAGNLAYRLQGDLVTDLRFIQEWDLLKVICLDLVGI